MLRRAWKPVLGTSVLVGTSAYVYHRFYRKPTTETFDIAVKAAGPDGKRQMATRTLPLLSKDEVDTRLRARASDKTIARPNGLVWRSTTAQFASNDPIEDAHGSLLIERDVFEEDFTRFYVAEVIFHPCRILSVYLTWITRWFLQLRRAISMASFTGISSLT